MTREVDRVTKDLEKFTEDQVKKLAVNVFRNLTLANPVDTGFSRARWFLNKGFAIVDNGVKSSAAAVPGQKAIQEATIDGIKVSYKLKDGAIYITNHTPYIGKLNDGSSAQAPSGFVQRSISIGIKQTK